jgi:hypothetical protein
MARRKRNCPRQAISWRFFSDKSLKNTHHKAKAASKILLISRRLHRISLHFFRLQIQPISHSQAHLRKGKCNKFRFEVNPQHTSVGSQLPEECNKFRFAVNPQSPITNPQSPTALTHHKQFSCQLSDNAFHFEFEQ